MSAPRSPSGEDAGAARVVPWTLIAVVVATLVVRLAVAGATHLTEDEAYYRLWAQNPALGYYDHPPMIAWWIWLGVRVAGDTALGVRLLPALACAVTSLVVFDLARLAGGAQRSGGPTAERAGVWYNAMLLVAAGGFLAVPDAPAALFWIATLWFVARASLSRSRGAAVRWWLAAGGAAGLATLSKYSSLFLGPGILLWLAWTPRGRRQLITPGPWLALGLAAGLFGLNAAWNADHHWLTFAKQFGRIGGRGLNLRYLPEFLVTQALLLNPLIAIFLVRSVRQLRAQGATDGEGEGLGVAFLLATSIPFVAYLLVHSLHDRVQAHWPAPVYPALAICAAFAAAACRPESAWGRLRAAAPLFGFAATAGLLLWLALPALGVPLRLDPGGPVRGWPAFATEIHALRTRNGAAWVGTTSYGLASELADEREIDAPILQISERARWPAPILGRTPDLSRPGLVIDLTRRVSPAALRRCFARVTPLGVIRRGAPGEAGKPYAAALVAGPRRDVVQTGC